MILLEQCVNKKGQQYVFFCCERCECMPSDNKAAKKELNILYGSRCMLTNIKSKRLTYHHCQAKKEFGGKATVENGANLIADIHSWLHSVESRDIEMYYLINECLLLYKQCLDKELTELVQDYEQEIMPKYCKELQIYRNRKRK